MGLIDGIVGTVVNSIDQNYQRQLQYNLAKSQRDFDMQLYERQRADAIEDRDFNSIGSLVKQYQAAGLNPDALAGTAPQASGLGAVTPPYGSEPTPDWLKKVSPLISVAGDLISGASTAIKTGIDAKNSRVDRYIKELGIPRARFNAAVAKADEEVFDKLGKSTYKDTVLTKLRNDHQQAENDTVKLMAESIINMIDHSATKTLVDTDAHGNPFINDEGRSLAANRVNSMYQTDTRDQNMFDAAMRKNRLTRLKADNEFEDWQHAAEQALQPVKQAIAEGQLTQIQAANAANDLINGLNISPEAKGVLLLLVNKVIPFGAELGSDFLGKKFNVMGQMKLKSAPTYADLH